MTAKSKSMKQPHRHKQTVKHVVMKDKPLTTSSDSLLSFPRTSQFHLTICVQVGGSIRGIPELPST